MIAFPRTEREVLQRWYEEGCTSLALYGRVRMAFDGVNVTVGGTLADLEHHVAVARAHQWLGEDVDYKLAISQGPCSPQAASESGFNTLSIALCKEVVSLGGAPLDLGVLAAAAAPHVTPQEFHALLERADSRGKPPVLLDVRNLYESRIGRMQAAGVQTLDPSIRCFSDLRAWLDAAAPNLAGRRVLMYCTGGVRCERASAYLRDKGPAFADVLQLQGGIQRYMEAFPGSDSLFRGSLFVFDDRVSVPRRAGEKQLGRCLRCSADCGDYSPRGRCDACRLLVLVCSACLRHQAFLFLVSSSHVTTWPLSTSAAAQCSPTLLLALLSCQGPAPAAPLEWPASLALLRDALRSDAGPYDGVMGFSQGAAVAAVLCALQQRAARASGAEPWPRLRFAVLCSGFQSPRAEHMQLLAAEAPLRLPSLHIYGALHHAERQVAVTESEALADAYAAESRHTVTHAGGHLVPAAKAHIARFRAFLSAFL
ncbi:hypothetical protein WJX81_000209 [Elliptochloris bilobata]|uniref:Rhodanese domain-containing protein n=1 Tax=Elliptochloris bilobata TaxID=381761 RepID=A0AAW1SEU3_9CHLO